jgi:hypothetical protein
MLNEANVATSGDAQAAGGWEIGKAIGHLR